MRAPTDRCQLLLLPADWLFTVQAVPYLAACSTIVPIGRMKIIEDSPGNGFDNFIWARFERCGRPELRIPRPQRRASATARDYRAGTRVAGMTGVVDIIRPAGGAGVTCISFTRIERRGSLVGFCDLHIVGYRMPSPSPRSPSRAHRRQAHLRPGRRQPRHPRLRPRGALVFPAESRSPAMTAWRPCCGAGGAARHHAGRWARRGRAWT